MATYDSFDELRQEDPPAVRRANGVTKASAINLVWLGVIGCVAASWTPGLLGLIAFLLMDLSLRAAEIARSVKSLTAVFSAEPEEMTEERADALSESIMRRLHEDMRLSAARRGH